MCMRWRAAMAGDMYQPLTGKVEVDETYIGGKDRNRHKGKRAPRLRKAKGAQKLGDCRRLRQGRRDWRYRAQGQRRGSRHRLYGRAYPWAFVRRATDEKVSLVATDENPAYKFVRDGMPHQTVGHTRGEYVRGNVHTNSIESFWAF